MSLKTTLQPSIKRMHSLFLILGVLYPPDRMTWVLYFRYTRPRGTGLQERTDHQQRLSEIYLRDGPLSTHLFYSIPRPNILLREKVHAMSNQRLICSIDVTWSTYPEQVAHDIQHLPFGKYSWPLCSGENMPRVLLDWSNLPSRPLTNNSNTTLNVFQRLARTPNSFSHVLRQSGSICN